MERFEKDRSIIENILILGLISVVEQYNVVNVKMFFNFFASIISFIRSPSDTMAVEVLYYNC